VENQTASVAGIKNLKVDLDLRLMEMTKDVAKWPSMNCGESHADFSPRSSNPPDALLLGKVVPNWGVGGGKPWPPSRTESIDPVMLP
jgi:hypothetical protein